MEFVILTEDEFDGFAKQQKNENFWQSVDMAHLRQRLGWQIAYAGVQKENRLQAAVMLSYRKVFLGKTYVQAVRGFYIEYHDSELLCFFHNALMKYLRSLNCMYFRMDPYVLLQERDIDGELVEDGLDNRFLIAEMKDMGYTYEASVVGSGTDREPGWMFVRDIESANEDQLLKEFDHQTRWSVRKSVKSGITIREGGLKDLAEFKKIMDHTAQRREFDDREERYYESLLATFGKTGNMKMLFAELDVTEYQKRLEGDIQKQNDDLQTVLELLEKQPGSKKYNKRKKDIEDQLQQIHKQHKESEELRKQGDVLSLAAAIFMTTGKEVVYLYSGAYREYLRFHGSYALQWYMFQYAIEHGYHSYNFYGISGDFRKSAPDYGVYEFKRGFGGKVVELIGEFTYVVRPGYYRLYNFLRKIKHMGRT